MVLEHLFPENWLEKKVGYAFLIAVIYSTIGIVAARLLFGANSGIVSVIFTSLLILPYLQKMFSKEEREEEKEKKVSVINLKSWLSFIKRNQAIRVYLSIFLGIYLTYNLYSFILPQLGFNTFNIFKEQLFVDPALRGRAVFSVGTFFSILANNWWVLLACFLLAIISGDGAIFFITWNASSWGAVMGYRALTAGMYSGKSALLYLLLVILITLPHLILEGGAYILAAISGSVISDEIIKEKQDIKNFFLFIILGGGVLFFIKYLISNLFFVQNTTWISLLSMIVIPAIIYYTGKLFQQKKLKKVFVNNYSLFVIAILVFIIGAIVETLVLNHASILNKIYSFSYLFGA